MVFDAQDRNHEAVLYMEARGMVVRRKIIPGMKAVGARGPEILADEDRVVIVLYQPPAFFPPAE